MNNLRKNLPVNLVLFASPRYWTDKAILANATKAVFDEVQANFSEEDTVIKQSIITNEAELQQFAGGSYPYAIFVPMSGAVQPWVTKAAECVDNVSVFAAYIKGVFSMTLSEWFLEKNAAPAVMDIYSVLRRTHKQLSLVKNFAEVKTVWKSAQAVYRLQGAKLVLFGQTEPWVISSSKHHEKFKEVFGVEIEVVPLQELFAEYDRTSAAAAQTIAQLWSTGALAIKEPNAEDIVKASRLTIAMENILARKQADGAAISCFELLGKIHTTTCLALSRLNDSEQFIGGCEGDLDSALTLLLVKALTGKPAWMANPNLQPDGSVNFVHCSAPLGTTGKPSAYILRSHHESGLGVSPEVNLQQNTVVTLVRVGNELNSMTVQTGVGIEQPNENSCRTQLRIKLDSPEAYLANVLGCHQVIVFGDVKKELMATAKLLQLEIAE